MSQPGDSDCDHNTIRVRRWPLGPVRWVCVRCGRWFKVKPDRVSDLDKGNSE